MQNLLFVAFEQLLDARIEAAVASGTYDIGVETLTAESFRVVERRTVHTHAATGAETRCYRVLRKDRNRPLPLAEALALRAEGGRLLINEQTRRAAVQMHAASLMDDDGNVEIRTRLIRPMTRETISVERFNHSHWRKATREEFAPLWEAECARVPEFSESAFHIITGLLLPIWDRLPAQNMRVYRFETDDGERVIGRLVTPEALDRVYAGLGVDGAPALSLTEAWSAVIERGAVLDLAGGLQIRRSLVMSAHRVELTGFSDGAVPQLKALGLTSEIIAWRLRLFVPVAADRGPAIALSTPRPPPAPPRQSPRCRLIRRCSVISAADLARRLARDAEAVCRHYLSNGHRQGRYWVIGDVMNTPGRSLYVRLTGPDSGPGAAGKWTDAATGEHGDLLDLIRLNRNLNGLGEAMDEARRFLALPRPSITSPTNLGHVPPAASSSSEAARRLFHAGRPVPGTPAEAYLRARGITGRLDWPALRYHPSVYYRDEAAQRKPAMLRSKPGRRCLLPSPISTAISPAFSAPGLIHGGRPRRRSPIRAAPLVICSAMASASAERPTFSPPAKASRPCWRSNRCCPHCLSLPGSRPTTSPPSTCPLPPDRVRGRLCAASMSPATTTRPVSRRRKGCTNAASPPASKSASSCRSMATSTSISAVSAPRACGHILRISSSPPTGRAFCPISPLRSAAVSPSVISVHSAPRRKKERLFVCLRRRALGRTEEPRCGLPERRFAGGEAGLQWRRPTIFRRRAIVQRIRTWGSLRSARLCSAKQNSCPAPSSALLRPQAPTPRDRSRGTPGCNPSPPPAKGSP